MSVDLSRLESVTARLEALESRLGGGGGGAVAAPKPAPPAGGGAGGPAAPFVKAYEDFLASFFAPVQAAAKALGAADVEGIVGALGEALQAQKQMLVVASRCRKPSSDAELQRALRATSEGMAKVDSLKDRRSKHFNHLAMVAEGAACLQWVVVEPTPAPYLSDVIPGSEMYGNKIMMEFKGKDENQVAFAKAFKALLLELQKYVKQHHTTGLSWNPSGGTDYAPSAAGAPALPTGGPPKAGGPPGPPPPPPPAGFFNDVKAKPAGGGGHAALFAELEAKGQAAAAGLRKVSKDQMTHKNPALRASNVVPASAAKTSESSSAAKPAAAAAKKPPKMENLGSKWFIENFENREDLQIDEASPKTSVLFVKNTKSLLQVPHKINTLSIDSCVKCRILVDSCIASIEIINCSSIQLQITGSTPMITMDGCAGVIVYLSKQCIADDVAIVSSKCSEMNIVLPAKSDEDDPIEMPIPEQFETRVQDGKLVTCPISHVGA